MELCLIHPMPPVQNKKVRELERCAQKLAKSGCSLLINRACLKDYLFNPERRPHQRALPLGNLPHVWSSVHLDVIDDKRIDIQSLYISIRFCVLQQLQQEFSRLHGPSTLRTFEGFCLCFATDTSTEPTERDDLFLLQNIFKVPVGKEDIPMR